MPEIPLETLAIAFGLSLSWTVLLWLTLWRAKRVKFDELLKLFARQESDEEA